VGDGDTGPNTGGMGAYSPVPIATDAVVDAIMNKAVGPTLRELAGRGVEYRGVLYAGLMLTQTGPKVVEYNVRFGDPECEVVVPRLQTDLGELCRAAAAGTTLPNVAFDDAACVTVVLASAGYPASPRAGDEITGVEDAAGVDGALVFHAGTRRRDGELVTNGGRVFAVSATGASVAEARARAYDAADRIEWEGRHRRGDIAAGV
jgi:phosphoribosylamine---glycine ligase